MNGATKQVAAGAVVLVLAALGAWLVFAPRLPADRHGGGQENGTRSEIIRLAGRGELSDGEKKWLFERLSGEQFRAYQFNERERVLILRAIGG